MPVKLFHGDCLDVLKTMPDNSVDAVVTDPPYGLSDQSQEDVVECLTAWLVGKPYNHNKSGICGNDWDGWVPGPEVWRECLRVLKPGGHMLCFSGTRTVDLMGMAVRLAGFEIRDSVAWLYSQGLAHGLNIGKAIDKQAGAERKVIGIKKITYDGANRDPSKHGNPADQANIGENGFSKTPHGMPLTAPATEAAAQWEGWHSALKPSFEPILLCRKPLDGTIVENVLKHGVGGLNIDACRIPVDPEVDDPRLGGNGTWNTGNMAKNVYGDYGGKEVGSSPAGRFAPNVIHDGSEPVTQAFAEFGEKKSGVPGKRQKKHETHSMSGTLGNLDRTEVGYADKGSVARFYYCAKVSSKERGGSKHVSIKPKTLISYLLKLITPPGGTVLDPFAGSGSTGAAAIDEGFNAILVEREAEYIKDIENRLFFFLDGETTVIE